MKISRITQITLSACSILIAISLSYYYLFFLPGKERHKVMTDCITYVTKEMKDEHPKMETEEITNFRISHDRECFLKAGGMEKDGNNNFNQEYDTCRNKLMEEVNRRIEAEKSSRIAQCINHY